MEIQNVTLSIKKDVLRKAKILAIQRQTSLSALLTQTIEDLVNQNDAYDLAFRKHQALLASGYDLNTHGIAPVPREALHDR